MQQVSQTIGHDAAKLGGGFHTPSTLPVAGVGAHAELRAARLRPSWREDAVHRLTRILLRPECWLRLLQAVPILVAATRGTKGCVAFDVYVSATRTGEVTMIGCWSSAAAAAIHDGAEHTIAFMRLAAECAEAPPDVTTLTEA
ncbi:quinol monooxygenase YgiN [Humitalea rosea]|uniref:Quinol monooxygenase YgiN n=1 Tax=Humitalea rosea TaxID=990373 RepID=A0A2W7HVA2_9PROT|nr:quinol monooxygenase YgiN [Humitalea rosea]